MKKADIGRYYMNKPWGDDRTGGDMRFYSGERGGAAVFGAACPTVESHGGGACEKILRVIGDSFLGRPSLCDEAMNTLSDFANKSVFALQEPYKPFLADAALLFIRKGKARFILTGCAGIYYLSGGKAVPEVSKAGSYPLFGTKARFSGEVSPEFALSGTDAFIIVCGKGGGLDPERPESSFEGISGAEDWAERLNGEFPPDSRLALMTVLLPERKGILFSKRKEQL